MDYYRVEESLQVLFRQFMPLSAAQRKRIEQVCMGVLLGGSSQVSQIGRWLPQANQQDSRERWLQRVFAAPYLRQAYAYAPLVQHALAGSHAPV